MLHYETVEQGTLELLKKLQTIEMLKGTRLVGGTSLALQIGHRKSIDLDLFGLIDYEEDDLDSQLEKIGNVTLLKKTKNIRIYIIDNVKVDIVNYEYGWLLPAIEEDGIVLAQKEDIAAMKINAVIGRGTKKDFIDIAYLLQIYTLSDILRFYFNKYPDASIFLASKSLAYYDDAEQDPMPFMFTDTTWEQLKAYISSKYDEYEANY